MNDAAMNLLAKIETLSSLLRAASDLGSSIVTVDPRVRDLIRLADLARAESEMIESAAPRAVTEPVAPPSRIAQSNQP